MNNLNVSIDLPLLNVKINTFLKLQSNNKKTIKKTIFLKKSL